MGAYTGDLSFKLQGDVPGETYPSRLVWDSQESVWESIPNDSDDPNQVDKRRVLNITGHVVIKAIHTTYPVFRDFMEQELVFNPTFQYPSTNGKSNQGRLFRGPFGILQIQTARIGDGNLARVSMTLQSRWAYTSGVSAVS